MRIQRRARKRAIWARQLVHKHRRTSLDDALTPRLLLIEFFPNALRRNESSMLFPFLKGLAQKQGIPALWLCFGEGMRQERGGCQKGVFFIDLPKNDCKSLEIYINCFQPTHIISSEGLQGTARELVGGAVPPSSFLVMLSPSHGEGGCDNASLRAGAPSRNPEDRRYFAKSGWFFDWLGIRKPLRQPGYLIEDSPVDYQAVLVNEPAWTSRSHITVVSGAVCANRRVVRDNPLFKDVLPAPFPADSSRGDYYGCSFCGSRRTGLTSPGANLLALTKKQFQGIMKTGGAGGRNKGIYEFYDIRAFQRFDEVFAIILRLNIPPAIFLFNPRIDDVLKMKNRIKKTLPALAKAGHEVRIMSMGIENFSERENLRFNKGISLAQVDELLALAKKWEQAYPGIFKPFKGGCAEVELGFILFTPWTTFVDIRINLNRAAARHFTKGGFWLYSVLLIREDMPIYHLAKKDGDILIDRLQDRGMAYGLFKNEGHASLVVPWRFKDSRVADYFAMLVRICAVDREGKDCAFFRGDPEFPLVAELYTQTGAEARPSPLSVAMGLLDIFETAQPPYSRTALLRQAMAHAARELSPRTAVEEPRRMPGRSLKARAVETVIMRLRQANLRVFSDFKFKSVEEIVLFGARRIRLMFVVEGQRRTVDLLDVRSTVPCFLRSRHFRAVYHKDSPVTSPSERKQWSLLLRLIDRRIDEVRGGAKRVSAPHGRQRQ